MHITAANASASHQITRLISVDINFITLPLRKRSLRHLERTHDDVWGIITIIPWQVGKHNCELWWFCSVRSALVIFICCVFQCFSVVVFVFFRYSWKDVVDAKWRIQAAPANQTFIVIAMFASYIGAKIIIITDN